jgi:hypothetical protein
MLLVQVPSQEMRSLAHGRRRIFGRAIHIKQKGDFDQNSYDEILGSLASHFFNARRDKRGTR